MRTIVIAFCLVVATPLVAVENSDCAESIQLTSLYQIRSGELARSNRGIDEAIDRKVDELREPLENGDFRWVNWKRPDGEGPIEKDVSTVRATGDSAADTFEGSGQHAFGIRIFIPRKRSLLKANSAVYLGVVEVSYEVDGRTRTKSERINAWMNPDTSRTIDLGGIADRVEVTMGASTNKPGEAVVEIHFRQAVAVDDPKNPAFEAIRSLLRVRDAIDERDELDDEIARVEVRMFPGARPVPLLDIITDLRRADDLLNSKKTEDQEKGQKLMRETMRRLN